MSRQIPSPHEFREPVSKFTQLTADAPSVSQTVETPAQPATSEIEEANAKATAAWAEAQQLRQLAPKMNRKARRMGAAQGRSAAFKRLLKAAKRDAAKFLADNQGSLPTEDAKILEAAAQHAIATRIALSK